MYNAAPFGKSAPAGDDYGIKASLRSVVDTLGATAGIVLKVLHSPSKSEDSDLEHFAEEDHRIVVAEHVDSVGADATLLLSGHPVPDMDESLHD